MLFSLRLRRLKPYLSPLAPPPGRRTDPIYFILLVVLNIWGSGVQGLLAPLTTDLVTHFALEHGDIIISYLIAAFLALYAGASVGWAWLAERTSRHRVLTGTSGLWGLSCMAVSLSPGFPAFALTWCLTAVLSAALIPTTYSMAIDLVPPHRRGQAFGWLSMAQILSMGQSIVFGGLLVDHFGWRLPFLLTGALGLASMGLLLLLKRYEPARGGTEAALEQVFAAGQSYRATLRLADLKVLVAPLSNLYLLLATLALTLGISAPAGWFIRMLQKDQGMATSDATLFMMVLFGCQVPGSIFLGRLGDRVQQTHPQGRLRLLLALPVVSLPLYLLGFGVVAVPSLSATLGAAALPLFAVLVIGGAFTASGMAPLLLSTAGDINRPEARGVVFSLLNIARVAGRGLGGVMLTTAAAAFFGSRLSPGMALMSLWLFPATLLFVPVLRRYLEDRARVSEGLERYVAGQQGAAERGSSHDLEPGGARAGESSSPSPSQADGPER